MTFDAWVNATAEGLNAIEAASALHAWVPEFAVTTFNGANISAIKDQWGAADMAQGTVANQPPWLATGGPGGRPAVDLGSQTTRSLAATPGPYATGNRVSIYCVCRSVGTGGGSSSYFWPAAGGDTVSIYADNSLFKLFVDFDVGASFNGQLDSPAFDTNWHVRALRPLASGSLSQFGGVTTTPNPPGDGLAEIGNAAIGSPYALNNGGLVAGLFLVNNATAAKDTYLRNRLAAWFGAL